MCKTLIVWFTLSNKHRDHFRACVASKSELTEIFSPCSSYLRPLSPLPFLFKYLAPCCLPRSTVVSFFFKVPSVRLFHGLPSALLASTFRRCSHPLAAFLSLSSAFQQLPAVLPTLLYNGRYSTLLSSSNHYLCLQAKREMKAKLFDSALRRLAALAVSLLLQLFSLVSLFPSLSLSCSFPPPSLSPFRYARHPYFPL